MLVAETEISVITFTIVIGIVIILFYLIYNILFKTSPKEEEQTSAPNEEESSSAKIVEVNQKPKNVKETKKTQSSSNTNSNKEAQFKHKLLVKSLKSHSDNVTGIEFSPNGKYFLTTGSDRAIFLWSTKEFEAKQNKSIRCNVEFDHATKVRFSPDSRSFIVALGNSNTIRAYKINKKEDSNVQMVPAAVQDFPQVHKLDLINIGLSCSGKFIMTCSRDTIVNIWNTKGDILGTIDTKLMNNNYACVSKCGRFFGVCGFTPDVKVWEVVYDKTDNFKEIKRAFELTGHSAGVYEFAFNSDSTRMASVSKDQTWRLYDTNLDYQRGQDAKLLFTGNLNKKGASHVAISQDSYTLAVTVGDQLHLINALNGQTDQVIDNVCTESISEICFSIDNRYLAIACDRHVKVFFNITGHRVAIYDLKDKLRTAKTEAAKERIHQSIEEHQKTIEFINSYNSE